MSQAPEQHCLHTWSGQNAKELQQQLLSYWDDSELCYVMALRHGQLAGAMGVEYDEGLERGWLHGPHVATGDWGLVAGELLTRLLATLPACIEQLDAYLNVENVRLLLSAVDWLLDRAGVSWVCLDVGEELVNARRLYESVGFRLRFTGVGLEKTLARRRGVGGPFIIVNIYLT